MLDPLHSLHRLLWRWCLHMLSIRFSSFLLLVARSPTVASPTGVLMRGDSRWLACISPPGNVVSDGFSFCRLPCTGLPQLLMSCTLVCSLRCRFIAPSLLSGLARFSVDTVPWLSALSPSRPLCNRHQCRLRCVEGFAVTRTQRGGGSGPAAVGSCPISAWQCKGSVIARLGACAQCTSLHSVRQHPGGVCRQHA